jgi:hypothetical protein
MRIATAVIIVFLVVGAPSVVTAGSTDVPVTIRVRTSSGSPVENAYVALVPSWRPSSHPLVETISENGVVTLDAPAGEYGVIAAARGFSISTMGPVSISETEREFRIELAALNEATGRVIDAKGGPVEGARVTVLNGAIPAPLGNVSELLEHHSSADWQATTDAAGSWTLRLPEGSVPYLVQASGFGAEWQIVEAGEFSPSDTPLLPGATLTVVADREDPDLVITLASEESSVPSSIPVDKQPLIWARWAATTSLTWNSLPPGSYAIYAKYPEARFFTQAATKLASVTLSSGDARTVSVTLPAVRAAATKIASFYLPGMSRDDLGITLETFARDSTGLPRRSESFVEAVIGGSVVHIRADEVQPPFFALNEDRALFTVPALAEASSSPWPAASYPRADAHAQLRFVDDTLPAPRAGLARLRGCADGDEVAAPIEIRPSGFAQFTAAAGCRSVLLEFEPFEPILIEKSLQAGNQYLGEFTLRAAGSAEVHVVRDPGGAIVSGATVRITAHGDELREPVVVTEAVSDDTGWARVSGLPGYRELRVTAETPTHEKSDSAPVVVEPGQKVIVDPLAVPEPATLILDARIDEAFFARFPTARVVALRLQPFDRHRQTETQQLVPADEPLRIEPLHPGRWLVTGVVHVDGSYAPVELDDLELKAGETRHLEKRITPNVFEGIVLEDGTGVEAKVTIGSRPEEILAFNTGGDGTFRALLPRKGTHRVSVSRLSAQSNHMPVGEVSFDDPSRRVEIVIPKGASVTARVRKGDRPVPHARVWISRRDSAGVVDPIITRGRETDSSGEAKFDDLTPGVWNFSAKLDHRQGSAEKSISIASDEDQTIDLDLEPGAAIRGTVRALGGAPLPRARIDCIFVGATGNPDRASDVTDVDGAFDIELTAPAPPAAFCGITGPTGSVDAVRLATGQSSEITMPGSAAPLRIDHWESVVDPDAWWLVAPDGRATSVRSVATKLGQLGSPLTIPAMAAGQWMLIRVESLSQGLALARGLGATIPAVDETSLRAGVPGTIQIHKNPSHVRGSE